jgi:hypothetical protein
MLLVQAFGHPVRLAVASCGAPGKDRKKADGGCRKPESESLKTDGCFRMKRRKMAIFQNETSAPPIPRFSSLIPLGASPTTSLMLPKLSSFLLEWIEKIPDLSGARAFFLKIRHKPAFWNDSCLIFPGNGVIPWGIDSGRPCYGWLPALVNLPKPAPVCHIQP